MDDAMKENAAAVKEGKVGVEQVANQYMERLLNASSSAERELMKRNADAMGIDEQHASAQRSAMLQNPIRDAAMKSDDGGPVAKGLVDLRMKMEELDPGRVSFESGWATRAIGWIPGVGTPAKRYFAKYESAQTHLEAIEGSLKEGAQVLRRDNNTLEADQEQMRALCLKLANQIELGRRLDEKIEEQIANETDKQRRGFLEEEILFALRQRVVDLQQQLAVNQQGMVAMDILVRNNRELIRGVDRACTVTMSALRVGVTIATGLHNQRVQLEKINAANETATGLIPADRRRTPSSSRSRGPSSRSRRRGRASTWRC